MLQAAEERFAYILCHEARASEGSGRCMVAHAAKRKNGNLSHLGLYLLVCSFCCSCVALRACLGRP